jgi:hypothetical protein
MKTLKTSLIVTNPVPLVEFIEAAEKLDNQEKINHPNILTVPAEPQQVLPIGLVRRIINHFSVKITDLLGKLDYQLKNYAVSFNLGSKSKLKL